MKRCVLCAIALVLFLASCSKSDDQIPSRNGVVSIIAEIPEMPAGDQYESDFDTKASLSYVIRYNWTVGDRINVINLTTGKVLGGYLTADATGSVVTFSGSVSGTIRNTDKLLFLYPYKTATREYDFSSYQYDFSSQIGTSPEHCPFVVSAISSGFTSNDFHNTHLTFNYQMSYVQLNMANLPQREYVDFVEVHDVNSILKLTIENGLPRWNSYNVKSTIWGDEDASVIRLNPEYLRTTSQGTTILQFTCPNQSSFITERDVLVSSRNIYYYSSWEAVQFLPGNSYRHFVMDFEPRD